MRQSTNVTTSQATGDERNNKNVLLGGPGAILLNRSFERAHTSSESSSSGDSDSLGTFGGGKSVQGG